MGVFGIGPDLLAYAKQIDTAVDAFSEDVLNDACRPDLIRCQKLGIVAGAHKIPESPKYPYPPGTTTIASPYRQAWFNWAQDWHKYYNENVNVVFSSVTREALDQWKAQLDEFIKRAQAFGVKPATPPLKNLPTETKIPWTGILVVGGLIAAAFLLREVRGVGSLVLPGAGAGAPPLPPVPASSARRLPPASSSEPVSSGVYSVHSGAPTHAYDFEAPTRKASSHGPDSKPFSGPISAPHSLPATRRSGT